MRRVVLGALLSYWRRNLLQLFTLVAGLALATALWSGVQAINAEARASYDDAAQTLGGGQFDRLTMRGGGSMPLQTYVDLRRAGWQVSPVVEVVADGVSWLGLEPLTLPPGFAPGDMTDRSLSLATTLWAGEGTAVEVEGIEVIERPDIAFGTVLGEIGVVSRLTGATGISYLLVAGEASLGAPPLEAVAPDLMVESAQASTDFARLTDSFHLNLTAFGLLSFAVGIFIVHGAVGLAFEQRRPMIRTLRALGVPLTTLITILALELSILGLLSGCIGVILGYFVAAALLPDVAATLAGLYGASVSGTLSLNPVWWLSGLGISLIGTMVASVSALYRVARMPLLATANRRAWAVSGGKSQRRLAVIGLTLVVLAAVLAAVADTLYLGFAVLAALLIGAALLLPYLLARFFSVAASTARGPMAQWFWADSKQQVSGLSLALMALLLAMAANIGVSTMVSSFRLTFLGFLDQRLAAEVYVTTETREQADAFERWVADRVEAILPIDQWDDEVVGQPVEVYGPVDHVTYENNWAFLTSEPDAWQAVHAGRGAVINEQLAYRANLRVGEAISLKGAEFPIVGVYGDYGNPVGQVIIGREEYLRLYPDSFALQFGLRVNPDQSADLIEAITSEFGLPANYVVDQDRVKALSIEVFDRTFTVTNALNLLTLLVAGFAILMSLLTLSSMRVPQLAPVWAMGVTRRTLGRIEVARALMLAGLTSVLAVPLGLALAWVLLAIVNVAAFGWRLPMFVFPSAYVTLLIEAVLAALLAAAWPAWRLSRTPPAQLLKVFANER